MKFRIVPVVLCALLMGGLFSCENEQANPPERYQIIPQPQMITPLNGEFEFTENTSILISEENDALRFTAEYLANLFKASAGFDLAIETADQAGKGKVFLQLNKDQEGPEGAYELEVSPSQITIAANDAPGLLYGVQSLRQLLPDAVERSSVVDGQTWTVAAVQIKDQPRFPYRGMHMDVSRHFFDPAEIKTFIDRLAMFKFNRFHMHLTDDQGWRIQIKQYPELTEEGAWRTMNNQDEVCLERAKTDPSFALPKKFFKMKDGQEVYGGFYTQEEMREIIQYAADRSITILPEIDMPGHMKAAINSFPDLTCVDGAGWGETFSIPLCPCEESTYEFVENVLSEIADLFPSEYIHIGADEVEKTTWANAPQCKTLMQQEGLESVEELQSYFVKRMEQFLNSKGKKMIGWDEALEGGINASTTIMYWRGWVPEAPIEAAEGGHDVIMTPTSHCYFDYLPNDESLSHVYQFDPIPEALKGEKEEKIVGVQANLWSEYIPTMERLDYMSMPRMMSLAEVAWSKDKDEPLFLKKVDSIYKRLDYLGVSYRLPDIPNIPTNEVFIDEATLALTHPPVIEQIRYTTDGSIPEADDPLYTEPIPFKETTHFKVATFVSGRRAAVYDIHFEKQDYREAYDGPSEAGLKVSYYEAPIASVTELDALNKVKSSVESLVAIPSYANPDQIGLLFEGYIEVPETGIYTFALNTDDGSSMELGDKLVVDNDGGHAPRERTGQIALKKGKHPIKIRFFEGGGGELLEFTYHLKGKEDAKTLVPAQMLSH